MEHLFKLKKDGKTVGYAHINHYGQLMFRLPNESDWWCKDKFWELMRVKYGFGIPPCSYHPFVTKDKDGKDVFAGDIVKVYFGELPSTLTAKAKIIYSHCQFMAGGIEEDNNKGPWSLDSKHIELIEDKENAR